MMTKAMLSPEKRERIHFDTLLEQALQLIRKYAHQTWSDLAEHDPGLTLLQALAFGVSDLAYRHTLPLADLLTNSEKKTIFTEKFAPEQMLTCSPVTEDDYRRALLDLHSLDPRPKEEKTAPNFGPNFEHNFYFRNVQLKPESRLHRYHYWYNEAKREFSLAKPIDDSKNKAQRHVLLGGYDLYVELNFGMKQAQAEGPLNKFLKQHRNLCEEIRKVIWVEPSKQEFHAEIELDDDCQKPSFVMAQIMTVTEDFFCPVARRWTAKELEAQGKSYAAIYCGPQLQNGWIPELPPKRNYERESPINISSLVNPLLEIDGVKRIQKLGLGGSSTGSDMQWEYTVPRSQSIKVWSGDTWKQVLKQIHMHKNNSVVLLKRGQRINTDEVEVLKYIEQQRSLSMQSKQGSSSLPNGHWRKPGFYHDVSRHLPPCYGLQTLEPNQQQMQLRELQMQLREFLLPFEQQLLDGCEQLALLPKLLSFERGDEKHADDAHVCAHVWASRLDLIEKLSKIKKRLEKKNNDNPASTPQTKTADDPWPDFMRGKAQDLAKERSIINYLLSYFGTRPVSKILLQESIDIERGKDKEKIEKDFLAIQRGYLAQQGTLGYARASIRVDAVSALHRRIAARLGVGVELFKKEVSLDKLSFYVVEHRSLLPKQLPRDPTWLGQVRKKETEGYKLIVEFEKAIPELKVGQSINLDVGTLFIPSLKIEKSEGKSITVSLSDDKSLQKEVDKILTASKSAQLKRSHPIKVKTHADDILTLEFLDQQEDKTHTDDKVPLESAKLQEKLDLKVGQLIDFRLHDRCISRVMVREVSKDGNEIKVYFKDNIRLKNNANLFPEKAIIYLQMCDIWLKDKRHPIELCQNRGDVTIKENQELLRSDLYPSILKNEDKIIIKAKNSNNEFKKIVKPGNIRTGAFLIEIKPDEPLDFTDKDKYVWYLKGKENEKNDRFSFVLSIVFNRTWLENAREPDVMMKWVEQIVAEEVPCHLSTRIYWFENNRFNEFKETYSNWQNNDEPEDLSYSLLSQLSLGELPEALKGIGAVQIASQEQKEAIAKEPWKNKEVEDSGLFYIPSELSEVLKGIGAVQIASREQKEAIAKEPWNSKNIRSKRLFYIP